MREEERKEEVVEAFRSPPRARGISRTAIKQKDTAGLSKPVTRCVITRDRYRSLDVDLALS